VSWHLCVQVDSILINDNTAKKISKTKKTLLSVNNMQGILLANYFCVALILDYRVYQFDCTNITG